MKVLFELPSPFDKMMTIAKGESWHRMRTTLSPTFSGHKMKLMIPLINKSCDLLEEKLNEVVKTGETINIHTWVSYWHKVGGRDDPRPLPFVTHNNFHSSSETHRRHSKYISICLFNNKVWPRASAMKMIMYILDKVLSPIYCMFLALSLQASSLLQQSYQEIAIEILVN